MKYSVRCHFYIDFSHTKNWRADPRGPTFSGRVIHARATKTATPECRYADERPPAESDRDRESAAPEVFCKLVTKKEIKALFHAAGLNGVRFLGLREQEPKKRPKLLFFRSRKSFVVLFLYRQAIKWVF